MSIHQEVTINASLAAVYGGPDELGRLRPHDRWPHGRYRARGRRILNMFGGHISGRFVELDPGKRVVQARRLKARPEGVDSIVRFEFAGWERHQAVFDQADKPRGRPDDARRRLHEIYCKLMNVMFAA